MKECRVGGLAGTICRREFPEDCFFQDALKAERDEPRGLAAFRNTVERNRANCPKSEEVLTEIGRRIRQIERA